MPRTTKSLIAWFAIAATSLLPACGSGSGTQLGIATRYSVTVTPAENRELAPSISGPSVRESDPDIEPGDFDGRPVVVNFWGSWCGPCRKEEPILESAYRKLSDKVAFVGINTRRDQRTAAIAFLDEFDVSYPSVYDPSSAIAYAFGVRAMPTTFVIDEHGRIAVRIVGAVRSELQLMDVLDQVMTDGT